MMQDLGPILKEITDATDDQLHAAMVSLIEDITGNDRLQGLFLEALQTHFGELDDTSGRRS